MTPINFHIISLFPEAIESYLEASILGRAIGNKLITVSYYQLRDFSKNKHKRVDDNPYAGGPGMVLQALPVLNAVKNIQKKIKKKSKGKTNIIIFGASGKQFTNEYAIRLGKKFKNIILIAGRYEGIDARVQKILRAEEVSVGPYILTGGELPAAVVVDAVTRHIPGVLGKQSSIEERRIASPEVYTRPEILKYNNKNYHVPKVLLSGNHKNIELWKKKKRG